MGMNNTTQRTLIPLACVSLMTNSYGEEPEIEGEWAFAQLRGAYQTDGNENFLSFNSYSIETFSLDIFSDNRLVANGETFKWIFSDDLLVLIDSDVTENLTFNFTGDTFALAQGTPFGVPEQESAISVVVLPPEAPFTRTNFDNTEWKIYSKRVESEEGSGSDGERFLQEVSMECVELSLSDDLTFEAVILANNLAPSDVGEIITGTWQVNAGELELLIDGELLSTGPISAGGDLIVKTEAEEDQSSFKDTLELWIKTPQTLVASDIIGRWGGDILETDLTTNPSTLEQSLEGVRYEQSDFYFNADQTLTIITRLTNNPFDIGFVETFTWSIDGNDVLVTGSGFPARLSVSEQKDTIAVGVSELDTTSNLEEVRLTVLNKLPDAPGFAGAPIGIETVSNGIMNQVTLDAETSLLDVRYGVEKITNLTDVTLLPAVVDGDGGPFSFLVDETDDFNAFYRLKILSLTP